jgi:branched-chain amino acid transport system ATP-binding protein
VKWGIPGLAVPETRRFIQLLAALPTTLAVVFVEHDLDVVFGLAPPERPASRAPAADGDPEQVCQDPLVRTAYLRCRGPGIAS